MNYKSVGENEVQESYQSNHAVQKLHHRIPQPRHNEILDSYPEYGQTILLDYLRNIEYGYLDSEDHVYLDYTGSGLAARAQHRAHDSRLANTLFGNPHSINPTSEAATLLIEESRRRVLAHFNASAEEYCVIFTPNATGASRLLGESYQFCRGKRLVLTSDNHNSINGLREFAKKGKSSTTYVPCRASDLRTEPSAVKEALKKPTMSSITNRGSTNIKRGSSGLFAYPAQSNFSGVQHPLDWVSYAQERGYDVLLDVAAYLPTNSLDLSPSSNVRPDFLLVSWYKLFGYPTGVGCLIARREALSRLNRPWFSGGTIQAVSVTSMVHVMAADEAAFEDGTVNFLSIPDVTTGLEWLASIGLHNIKTRVLCLTGWFLDRLLALRHSNGNGMIRLYGPADIRMRGGTVAFNFLDPSGIIVPENLVQETSAKAGISLRTGCFCNPGCGEAALGIDGKTLKPWRHPSSNLSPRAHIVSSRVQPCVRVSFGLVSTAGDVDKFFEWAVSSYQDWSANDNY
ncbi:molybdenum cofactor sulfurase [Xylariales sp. PMI_506]|nr:molybdenum cofactor sulfurase [Xylariales sp. PMI_506]